VVGAFAILWPCACDPTEKELEERTAKEIPLPPTFPEAQEGTSVHPVDLAPVPPPEWYQENPYVEFRDGGRFIIASGSAGDAGNSPDAAFRAAELLAMTKIDAWLLANGGGGDRDGSRRVVENRIGEDGRAYVRVEAELEPNE
jgi:hypothetical protein